MKIAISGKGGAGKTTVAALLCRLLVEEGKTVLAIDADPSSNLADTLGLPPRLREQLVPLRERQEIVEERVGGGGGLYCLDPRVDDLLNRLAVEHEGIHLMVLGDIRPGEAGCRCPENALLRAFLHHIMTERDEAVIVDMEAGLEHLSRRTVEAVDLLLVVVEPHPNSIKVARRIAELAAEMGIGRISLLANKVTSEGERSLLQSQLHEGEILAFLPYSEMLRGPLGPDNFREIRESALYGQLEVLLTQL